MVEEAEFFSNYNGTIMNTAQQLLRNANIKPTAKIIADGLGTTNNAYLKFVEELKEYDISLMEWRYYNDGKAWLSKGEYKWVTIRGTHKVKPICWLSIWDGFFKVSFFFSVAVQDELLSLPISQEAKKMIKRNGAVGRKMKFMSVIFDVDKDRQLEDIYILAQFRKERI